MLKTIVDIFNTSVMVSLTLIACTIAIVKILVDVKVAITNLNRKAIHKKLIRRK